MGGGGPLLMSLIMHVILSHFDITLTFTHLYNNGAGIDTIKTNCSDGENDISIIMLRFVSMTECTVLNDQ